MRISILVVLLAACSTAEEITVTDFYEQSNVALCDRAFECRPQLEHSMDPVFEDFWGPSVDACVFQRDEQDIDLIDNDQHSIDLGRVIYHPEVAQRCIDFFRDAPCDHLLEAIGGGTACLGLFEGTVEIGGRCLNARDCAGNGLCDAATFTCVSR